MQINRKYYYQRKDSMSYLHILQHGCIMLVTLSRDLFKIYNPLVPVQGQNREQLSSRLSTRSIQSKIYDPLISVQAQNEEQRHSRLNTRTVQKSILTTLSSPYKVKTKNNDPFVSVQGQFNPKFTTLSSQYKVKMKNNDPLVSVQGQFKNQSSRPSRLNTRSKRITTTLSSKYKVNLRYATLSSQYKVLAYIYTFILLSFIFITERNQCFCPYLSFTQII